MRAQGIRGRDLHQGRCLTPRPDADPEWRIPRRDGATGTVAGSFRVVFADRVATFRTCSAVVQKRSIGLRCCWRGIDGVLPLLVAPGGDAAVLAMRRDDLPQGMGILSVMRHRRLFLGLSSGVCSLGFVVRDL